MFVTEEMLKRRIAGKVTSIELAANEFLTPAASDLAARRRVTVRRTRGPIGRPVAAVQSSPPVATAGATLASGQPSAGLLVDRPDEKVLGVLDALVHDGMVMADFSAGDCPIANLRSLCRAVVTGQVRSGVAIVRYAADPMVLANKVKGIRAVQGTCLESVLAGVRRFNANLLIVEHSYRTLHEMRGMVRAFVSAASSAGRANRILAAVQELENS